MGIDGTMYRTGQYCFGDSRASLGRGGQLHKADPPDSFGLGQILPD